MRIRNTVVVIAMACSTTLFAAGDDNKATEVIAAARKAIGAKLDALKTLSVDAAVLRNINDLQLNADVELLIDLPGRYLRTESMVGGPMSVSTTVGFDGEKAIRPANVQGLPGGGMMIRMGPGGPISQEKPSAEEQARMDAQMIRGHRAEISRLMLGWFAQAHPAANARYTYAGEAESPDGKAHVIDVKNDDGFSARVFIDQQTSLPLMVTYQAPQPRVVMQGGPRPAAPPAHGGQAREMTEEERTKAREEAMKRIQSEPPQLADFTLFFDDWRSVDGVMFPHKIRRAVAGATNEEWTINKVKVNPKIDPKKFQG